ncbi:protein phosphatase 1 regulatory subunit 3F-like [Panicum miliaceum]|uniref:Protein phosphatase 1 regulatory subunit 3F-like n=1 Tax=Panicum miliaceum TaxID=4540 RepID=A0A3L6PFZ0_PANMI|nr:protein phosphatase 1 regulatory subunit 3F-like [Panicum miliaceum]
MVEAGASFMVLGTDLFASPLGVSPVRPRTRAGSGGGFQPELLTMGGVCFRAQDKVEAAADEDGGVDGASMDTGEGEEIGEIAPLEPLPEPPDDGGPVAWPMPDFCPLTIDGAVKESFLETLRKDAAETERPPREDAEAEEVMSPDSRPSSSKRHRGGTASPSSRSSPYRNILQVFQQCRQDVVGETPAKNC